MEYLEREHEQLKFILHRDSSTHESYKEIHLLLVMPVNWK